MLPVVIAPPPAGRWWRWLPGVAFQPVFDHVVEELLGPEQASVGLAHHPACFRPESRRDARSIEVVGFLHALRQRTVKVSPKGDCRGLVLSVETQAEMHFAPGWHVDTVIKCRLGTACSRVHCGGLATHHVGIKGIFDVGSGVRKTEEPRGIRLILGKQTPWGVTARQW